MNSRDFFEGLKGDGEDFHEKVASAEHFIRLKKQVVFDGGGKEKTAKIFGASEPGVIEHTAIPHKDRRGYYEEYLNTKKNEEPTGYLKGTLGGAGVGAATGALLGLGGGGLGGVAAGGVSGGLVGAGLGALMAKVDKDNIAHAKGVKPHQISREMHNAIQRRYDARETSREVNTERRHQELMDKLGSSMTLRSRVMVAFEKRAVSSSTAALLGAAGTGAALGAATTYLSSKPRSELGGRSKDEDITSRSVAENQSRPEEGFVRKIRNRSTELSHGLATAFREHPGKASAVGAATGALTGYSLAKGVISGVNAARKRAGK